MYRTDDEIHVFCKKYLKLDIATGIAQRSEVASVVLVWEACRARSTAGAEVKAQAIAAGLPTHIPRKDYLQLVDMWTGKKKVSRKDTPFPRLSLSPSSKRWMIILWMLRLLRNFRNRPKTRPKTEWNKQ